MREIWADFHFAQKGAGPFEAPLLPDLPDSTMTFRGRSDGLVVESDRKKISFCLNNGESILSILNTKLLHSKVFCYKLRYIFYRPYQIQITKYSKQLKYVFQIQVIEILPISAHTHTHKCTHIHRYTHTHTHTHTYINAHSYSIHSQTHTHTHRDTHTH